MKGGGRDKSSQNTSTANPPANPFPPQCPLSSYTASREDSKTLHILAGRSQGPLSQPKWTPARHLHRCLSPPLTISDLAAAGIARVWCGR